MRGYGQVRVGLPRSFLHYTVALAALAVLAAASLAAAGPVRLEDPLLFGLLAAFVLAGELLPIPVPQRAELESVTVSGAFALAILLTFGPAPAIAVYVVGSVLADARDRVAPLKILFNASQYALSLSAAGALVVLSAEKLPLAPRGATLVLILAVLALCFAVNHVLHCIGGALVARLPVLRYLREDLGFQAWTAGCVVAFAPVVMIAARWGAEFVPLSFLPMVAIYVGGREAAANAHRAYHDALTELPNRALLAERLEAMLDAAGETGEISVMLLDLDDFKAVNDTLGHEIGDEVLREIGHRLQADLDPGMVLARLGGDEFAAALPAGREAAGSLAQRLLAAVERPLEVDALSLEVRGSIGIACAGGRARAHDLMRQADVALYVAKTIDRGYAFYSQADDENTLDRLVLASHLRRGIERGELVVHYQPKISLHGGPTTSVEALVRWNHPQLGCIGPDGFIPLAEQSGLIKPLTLAVLESSLRQCRAWLDEGLEIRVAVNVSTRSLLDHDLPGAIRDLLERFRLPAGTLQLEITESRVVSDVGRARGVLEELRAMGMTIAIDDFGTGFSSLAQLQQLPIDEIKIDRSFVSRMSTRQADAVLVRSIVDLGRNLGLRVTAEGVEDEEIAAAVRALGCDFGQGFHLGAPMDAFECRRRFLGHERSSLPGPEPLRMLLAGS